MILVVNAGSSSLKMLWQENSQKIMTAKWDKTHSWVIFRGISQEEISLAYHEPVKAFEFIIERSKQILTDKDFKFPEKVGYRVVQGGELFTSTTEVTEAVLNRLATIDGLAPNHNPITRAIVEKGLELMPSSRQFLCFDTMFHQTMPMIAKMYGIDLKYYRKGIRKFGFHGISHEYVAHKTAEKLGKSINDFSGIICHLGNGSSITAIENGKSVDTTMGLTPVDGLVMGERSGSVDPSVIKLISKVEGIELDETVELLSKHSGFKAISGLTSDYRALKEAVDSNPNAKIAIELFKYQITKYIGAFMAILSHVDAIVFTGGIGENDSDLVNDIISSPGLRNMGINRTIPVFQIPTDEELAIASLIDKE